MKHEPELLQIAFEPGFVEDAVFLKIRSLERQGDLKTVSDFHRSIEVVYEGDSDEQQDDWFRKTYDHFFRQLGLADVFWEAVSGYQGFQENNLKFIIQRAWRAKDEGSELYVRGEVKWVLVNVRTLRVLSPADLTAFLHHELRHIADMLDPDFGYRPDPALDGASEIEDNLIRERFRILWDIYVSARNGMHGIPALIPSAQSRYELDTAFSFLPPEEREALFQETSSCGKKFTQEELIRLARMRRAQACAETNTP